MPCITSWLIPIDGTAGGGIVGRLPKLQIASDLANVSISTDIEVFNGRKWTCMFVILMTIHVLRQWFAMLVAPNIQDL